MSTSIVYSLLCLIGLQHPAVKSPVVSFHAFIVSAPYHQRPLEPLGVPLTTLSAPQHDDCGVS